MTKGRIHSIETMGLVDGPGIRVVVFLQGCSLRCKFCHNPDTWLLQGGKEYTPENLVRKISRFKTYFKDKGGVTFSGGEPLMQPEFLLETLKLCKKTGINTCIDTAGCGNGQYDEILKYTDLVLFDIKHFKDIDYENITGMNMDKANVFLNAMKRNNTKIWIRHVIVPGITDSKEHILELKHYIDKIPNVERVELLPYHLLGVNKYEKLNIDYPLKNVPAMDKEKCEEYQKIFT